MIEERSIFDRIADTLIYTFLAALALVCLLPFINVLALSFSSRAAVSTGQVSLWPIGFNLQNYEYILADKMFLASFGNSIVRVLAGVSAILLVAVLTAYPLSRDRMYMPGRTIYKVLLLIGMLFSGGLIPFFLAIRAMGLYGNFLVLIIPGALNVFYAIILINFFRGIPQELEEAAVLDGASHADVLFRVFIPISTPALATIALFAAVQHWNSWFDGIVFMNDRESWPVQSLMYAIITTRQLNWNVGAGLQGFVNATPEGLRSAMIFVATVPILLVYPFLQRYFVTGLTIGSVKG
jgi:putative aldouronate transport system permease protein